MKTLEQAKEKAMKILNKPDDDRKERKQLAVDMLIQAGMLPHQAMLFVDSHTRS